MPQPLLKILKMAKYPQVVLWIQEATVEIPKEIKRAKRVEAQVVQTPTSTLRPQIVISSQPQTLK